MLTRSTRFLLDQHDSIRPYSIAPRSIPDPIRSHSISTRSYTITSRAYAIATRVDPIATRLCSRAMSFNTFLQKGAKILIRLSLVARYLETEVDTDAANTAGKKARLAVAAVLAATASPEPSPQKAKRGYGGQHQHQLKSMTPAMTLLLENLYIFFAAQITTLT